MLRRRSLLAGTGLALLSPVSGCTDLPELGSSGPHPAEQFVPSPAAIDGYASRLRDYDYTVWGVDVATVRSQLDGLSEDARRQFGTQIPVRHHVYHEDVGIEYGAIDDLVFAGVPVVNTFPRGVDHIGMLVASITVGDFDRGDVVESLRGDLQQEDYAGVARFLDDELSYAVDDGWLVSGFDPVVRATVDSRREEADRYVDVDPAVTRIVDDLAGTTFFSATRHDRHEVTDPENGTLAGQIAEGFGYTFTDDGPSLDAVLVFDDVESVEEDAVAEWARDQLANVPDPTVSVNGRAATITGATDTDVLRYTTIAFYPFVFADSSPRSV